MSGISLATLLSNDKSLAMLNTVFWAKEMAFV